MSHPALVGLSLPEGWQWDEDPILPGAPEAQIVWPAHGLAAVIAHADPLRRWTLFARFQLFRIGGGKLLATDEWPLFLAAFHHATAQK